MAIACCWTLAIKKRKFVGLLVFFLLLLYCLAMLFTRTTPTDVNSWEKCCNIIPWTYFDAIHPVRRQRYVTFGQAFDDGRGLGNQLFNFASIMYVAAITDRLPVFVNLKYTTGLEQVFDLHIGRHAGDPCPCRDFRETKSLTFDTKLEQFVLGVPDNENIKMIGFYQSWKYTKSIERSLRRNLIFKQHLRQSVDRFIADNVPPNWIKSYVRIGVHVRRGDIMAPEKIAFGYTIPNSTYFLRAMKLLVEFYGPRIQFIVVSNDPEWCKKHFPIIESELVGGSDNPSKDKYSTANPENNHGEAHINVTYSIGRSAGEDLALLASCDHTIMSTGTFGWWAAWLAKGTTVFYDAWPGNNSALQSVFNRQDFFPPSWIGFGD